MKMEDNLDKFDELQRTLEEGIPVCISIPACSKDFPFMCDDETVDYINKINVMFILRGLPGTSNKTIVERMKSKYPMAVSCSVDDYLIHDGIFTFDKAKLKEAHVHCLQLAQQLVKNGTRIIIIDNTNLLCHSMSAYFDLATKNHYVVVIFSPETDWGTDLEQLEVRIMHNRSLQCLGEDLKLYKEIYPMYWGWFFSDCQYTSLTTMVEKYFPICLQYVPELYRYLRYYVKGDKELTFDALYSNGKLPVPGRMLHCTAFYAGPNGKDNPDVVSYANREAVKESIGKSFQLTVVGIFITPRTVGARVCLSSSQMAVWKSDPVDQIPFENYIDEPAHERTVSNEIHDSDEKKKMMINDEANERNTFFEEVGPEYFVPERNATSSSDAHVCRDIGIDHSNSELLKCVSKESLDDWILLDTSNMSPQTMSNVFTSSNVNTDLVDGYIVATSKEASLNIVDATLKTEGAFQENSIVQLVKEYDEPLTSFLPCSREVSEDDQLPAGSRAHMTLGCADGIEPVQTGFDLLDILLCEKRKEIVGESFHIDGATLSYYGEGRCTIYFDKPCYICTIFSGKY